jgi:hypothetical protein
VKGWFRPVVQMHLPQEALLVSGLVRWLFRGAQLASSPEKRYWELSEHLSDKFVADTV